MFTTTQLAYFAGLFDGEGSVAIERSTQGDHKTGPRYQLKVVITIREHWLLKELHAEYGGCLTEVAARKPGWSPVGRWRPTDVAATRFLEEVLPYLRIKKKHAEIGLEFRRVKRSFKRGKSAKRTPEQIEAQTASYEAMRKLNRRGVSRITQ